MCSGGCIHCYAKGMAETRHEHMFRNAYEKAGFKDWKTRPVWGDRATRVLTRGFWKDARRLNAQHAAAGTRGRWFPSLIDWLDTMPSGIIDQDGNTLDPLGVLADFLETVRQCRHIDWLLLTKRPGLFFTRLKAVLMLMSRATAENHYPVDGVCWLQQWVMSGMPPANVWIGVTTEDQERADERIPQLLLIPANVRFLSVEPLLAAIDLRLNRNGHSLQRRIADDIDWIIVGGESNGRPCDIEWIRGVVKQCRTAGVRVFVKQLGSIPMMNEQLWRSLEMAPMLKARNDRKVPEGYVPLLLGHPKGGEMSEWPEDLRVREYPDAELVESGVEA
jgi:protein gp37